METKNDLISRDLGWVPSQIINFRALCMRQPNITRSTKPLTKIHLPKNVFTAGVFDKKFGFSPELSLLFHCSSRFCFTDQERALANNDIGTICKVFYGGNFCVTAKI